MGQRERTGTWVREFWGYGRKLREIHTKRQSRQLLWERRASTEGSILAWDWMRELGLKLTGRKGVVLGHR